MHAAAQDAAPLLLLVGHVRRAQIGKDVFQELDCLQMFGRLAKGVCDNDRTDGELGQRTNHRESHSSSDHRSPDRDSQNHDDWRCSDEPVISSSLLEGLVLKRKRRNEEHEERRDTAQNHVQSCCGER